jgi:TPR repeat protein
MRTFDRTLALIALGLGVGVAPALGFDGTTTPRPTLQSLPSPDAAGEVISLQYAAQQGSPSAQWKLGNMYQRGDGVPRSDLQAFKYFGQIASAHVDDGPDSPNARLVASALVAVGQYYLDGIPNSDLKPDAGRARHTFFYAATVFGDPEAQYRLGRLFLTGGQGVPREPLQAARWLKLAANKDQHAAQALLGEMLIKGDQVPRQAAKGLMYLIIARDGAASEEKWIRDTYDAAIARANDDDRSAARIYLQQWLRGIRD